MYDLYWQYICEQIIRCFHSLSEAIVLNDTDHSSIEYYSNPDTGITNYYLSKHYFLKNLNNPTSIRRTMALKIVYMLVQLYLF